MQTAIERIRKARAGLILDNPFFGCLAIRLEVKEDKGCKTFWTDGKAMGFNPAFADKLSDKEMQGVIAHEVMHVALEHILRRGDREAKQWNQACDYAINSVLLESGFTLPEGGLVDSAYDGMASEAIYPELSKDKQPEEKQGRSVHGKDGQGEPSEDGQPDNGMGEVRDAKGKDGKAPSEAEARAMSQEVKTMVRQAATLAKGQGKLPGALARLVETALESKVDWRDVLRRFLSEKAKDDYSWNRPNRRFISSGLYLPSVHSEKLPEFAIAIDTSGSIDSDQLARFISEINAIACEYPVGKVHVLDCDAEINGIKEYGQEDFPITFKCQGGGGTNFRPVFDYCKQHDEIRFLVYLTDGCGTYPEAETVETLWILTEKYDVPFGESVLM